MPKTDTTSPPGGQLERGAMGTADIMFFVLAGVAPMGAGGAVMAGRQPAHEPSDPATPRPGQSCATSGLAASGLARRLNRRLA